MALHLRWRHSVYFFSKRHILRGPIHGVSVFGKSHRTRTKARSWYQDGRGWGRYEIRRKRTANGCLWVFPNEAGTGPALTTTLDHQHKRVRTKLSLSEEFVLHSLRHTALSRAAVACNGNVFELKEISGHASTKMLERYVHPDGGNTKAILQAASSGHQVVTRRKPSRVKSLQTAVNKQAGA